LLEFARLDLQGLEIHPEPGYLYGLLREMEQEAVVMAERRTNRFESEMPGDLPVAVQADFRRLRQVLLNLLGNAAKFTTGGRIVLKVERLSQDAKALKLRFTIADTGSGISADEQEKIMQPFGRGANAQGVEGMGLGLSIVRQLLEGMGSRLELETPADAGSRFSFTLDLPLAEEDDIGQPYTESYATSLVDGTGRRILFADDLAGNRDELAALLGGYGFDVDTAPDGLAALDKLNLGEAFDLLITDQMMPRMGGWALLAKVRERWPRLPVLLYSAAPPLPPVDWPADIRFDAALLKPAASSELLRVVDGLAPSR
jgi:CheY-like chemotaxis protein